MWQEHRIDHKVHLSYKDILLVPYDEPGQCNTVMSRNDPDISSQIAPNTWLDVPLIASPMDTITGTEMIEALDKVGALGIHTRYISSEHEAELQIDAVRYLARQGLAGSIACAIGVKEGTFAHAQALCDEGVNLLCVDIANGNHQLMLNLLSKLQKLKDSYGISIMAGNVATSHAAHNLVQCGVDAIKIGIGPGGACTTRRVTGFGVPQLTAILDCYDLMRRINSPVKLIADGGVRTSGDVVKALWAGADAVMAGYIFAGHDECPKLEENGTRHYRGMSSRTVSGRTDVAPEGVDMVVDSRGPVVVTVKSYAAAIKAGCALANAQNIADLRKNVRAVRVSTMSHGESEPVQTNYTE